MLLAYPLAAAAADTLEVQPFRTYKTAPDEITLISEARDGGYVLHGITRLPHPQPRGHWIARWTEDFSEEWQRSLATPFASLSVEFFIDVGDGYLLGTRNRVDDEDRLAKEHPDEQPYAIGLRADRSSIEVMTRLSRDVSHKSVTDIPGLGGNRIACAVAVEDGFIASGWKEVEVPDVLSEAGPARAMAPWLFRADRQGHTIWEKTFPMQGDVVLSWSPRDSRSCDRQLLKNADGGVVAVFNAHRRKIEGVKEGRHIVEEKMYGRPPLGNLLIRLGADGDEISRGRSAGSAVDSFLFKVGDKYVLIENYDAAIPARIKDAADGASSEAGFARALGEARLWLLVNPPGIRYTELDKDLKPLLRVESKAAALADNLRSVVPSPDGGYYLAGCGRESGVAVGYMDAHGRLGGVENANPRAIVSCSLAGMVSAPKRGGAVVVVDNQDSFSGKPTTYTLYLVKRK